MISTKQIVSHCKINQNLLCNKLIFYSQIKKLLFEHYPDSNKDTIPESIGQAVDRHME